MCWHGLLRELKYLRRLVSAHGDNCLQIKIKSFGATVTELNEEWRLENKEEEI